MATIGKPVLYPVKPFTALQAHTFTFMYQGAQVHKNQLLITAADDELDIYYEAEPNTQTTLSTNHVVPGNTLANGKQYMARVRVAPKDGQWSAWSDPIKFWCFGVPTFHFLINGEQVLGSGSRPTVQIQNSSVDVGLFYYQAQREGLKSYKVDLYGQDGRLILEGSERYNTGDIRYDTVEGVTVRGLEDNHVYSIQAVGETDHGMIITSDRVYLDVNYDHPATFSLIEVENVAEDAVIRIHSNLILFEGWSNQVPPRYIDNDRIDLTPYGAFVMFDQGFNCSGDFALHMVGQNFHDYADILTIQNGDYTITLKIMRGWYDADMKEQCYLLLKVLNATGNYELVSTFMDVPYFDDQVHIYLMRKAGLYELNWCISKSGSHEISNPKCFDVWLKNDSDWRAVITQGYRNLEDERLEF